MGHSLPPGSPPEVSTSATHLSATPGRHARAATHLIRHSASISLPGVLHLPGSSCLPGCSAWVSPAWVTTHSCHALGATTCSLLPPAASPPPAFLHTPAGAPPLPQCSSACVTHCHLGPPATAWVAHLPGSLHLGATCLAPHCTLGATHWGPPHHHHSATTTWSATCLRLAPPRARTWSSHLPGPPASGLLPPGFSPAWLPPLPPWVLPPPWVSTTTT
ncbi:hypothetical protein GPJ56_007222 [Histomonas meleagridis]|nr:hypothetical protein GPJ56_007222 [Histomonas meleagridis]